MMITLLWKEEKRLDFLCLHQLLHCTPLDSAHLNTLSSALSMSICLVIQCRFSNIKLSLPCSWAIDFLRSIGNLSKITWTKSDPYMSGVWPMDSNRCTYVILVCLYKTSSYIHHLSVLEHHCEDSSYSICVQGFSNKYAYFYKLAI